MLGPSIRFARDWRLAYKPDGTTIYLPILPILIRTPSGLVERDFSVDSGAEISMAPFELFEELGLRWRDGDRFLVQGIARRRGCALAGRVHMVDFLIPGPGILMRIPMVFVRGNAPYVLGRDTFFEAFRVTFDPANRRTVFELVDR